MKRVLWMVPIIVMLSLTACLSPSMLQSAIAVVDNRPESGDVTTEPEVVPETVELTVSNDTPYEITALTVRTATGESRPLDVLVASGSEVTIEAPAGTVTLSAYLDINGTLSEVSEELVLDGRSGARYRWSVMDVPPDDVALGYGYMDGPTGDTGPYGYMDGYDDDPYAYLAPSDTGSYAYLRGFENWLASLATDQ
jgi:hypothetical protein